MYNKNTLITLLIALCLSSSLFTIDDKTTHILDNDFMNQKENQTYSDLILPKDNRGPFFSSNAGIAFDFNGSRATYRSTVYEAILGYHLSNRFKLGAAYQYYAPVKYSYNYQYRDYFSGKAEVRNTKFDVHIQSMALKLYFSPEYPIRWNDFIMSPYLSFGAGLGHIQYKNKNNFSTSAAIKIKNLWALYPLITGEGGLTVGTQLIALTTGFRVSRFQSAVTKTGFFTLDPYLGLQISF